MFTPIHMRSANTYKAVDMDSAVLGADPHQLVVLMFSTLFQSLNKAKLAIQQRDIATKVRSINHAIRILEEGLKASLDTNRGGDLAANLAKLYDFCILQLTQANARSDVAMVDEVVKVIQPVADGWNAIRAEVVSHKFTN